MKVCTTCKTAKDFSCFSRAKQGRHGLRAACKSCTSIKFKKYRAAHKEKLALNWANWKRANSEHRTEYVRVYCAKKRTENPAFKLATNLRNRLAKALKKCKAQKSHGTFKLVSCTPKELKHYIEQQFQTGMTWDNYGQWHIDHIKPLTSFDLTKQEEQLAANHFTNLQPLWAADNIRKGNKYV